MVLPSDTAIRTALHACPRYASARVGSDAAAKPGALNVAGITYSGAGIPRTGAMST